MELTGEITAEKLDFIKMPIAWLGFTYRCFPSPLNGHFRIDYYGDNTNVFPKGWKIFVTSGDADYYLREVATMEQINNFYHGICDKYLF